MITSDDAFAFKATNSEVVDVTLSHCGRSVIACRFSPFLADAAFASNARPVAKDPHSDFAGAAFLYSAADVATSGIDSRLLIRRRRAQR